MSSRDPWQELQPRRKSLVEEILSRMSGDISSLGDSGRVPTTVPSAPVAPIDTPSTTNGSVYGPPSPSPSPSLSEQMMDQYKQKYETKPTVKGTLLNLVMNTAPVAAAGLAGGQYAALGAAQGMQQANEGILNRREARRKSLLDEIEKQRGLEERNTERQMTVQEQQRQHDLMQQELNARLAEQQNVAETAASARKSAAETAKTGRIAAVAGKTITRLGPDNKPHVYQMNPETLQYDIDAGLAYEKPGALEKLGPGDVLIDPTTHQPLYTNPRETAPKNIDPLSSEGINARLSLEKKIKELGNGPQDMAPLAGMVQQSPTLLKELPPKDKAGLLDYMARNGQTFQGKDTAMVDRALDTISTMENHPGFKTAVGLPGAATRLFGLKSEPMAGTDAAGFIDQYNALKAQLTLPNLDMLKGMGRVTDREYQALTSAMTALNPNMKQSEFKAELSKVKSVLQGMHDRNQDGSKPTENSPKIIRYDKNGNRVQ